MKNYLTFTLGAFDRRRCGCSGPDLRVLLLDVLHDDPQADLGHLFQLRVSRAAGGAVPGLQPVQQVHHPLEYLKYNSGCQTKEREKRLNLFPHLAANNVKR